MVIFQINLPVSVRMGSPEENVIQVKQIEAAELNDNLLNDNKVLSF